VADFNFNIFFLRLPAPPPKNRKQQNNKVPRFRFLSPSKGSLSKGCRRLKTPTT